MEGSQGSSRPRFLAIVALARRATETFQRFPFALIAAIGAAR